MEEGRTPSKSGIKAWPAGERPQERLLRSGASSLTDAELLAILLRTGTRGKDVLEVARSLMGEARSLRGLGRISQRGLMSLSGVGRVKAAVILAAVEIGRRVQAACDEDVPLLRTPEDVARRMIPTLRDRSQEVFVVLILDANNGLRAEVEISRGTLTASLVHPREVFRAAIEGLAASIIAVHNHPSGNPEPSREDLDITRQLAEAGRVVGIPLHDHLIIAGNRYTSLAQRGLIG
jgi:DNA repair protein RadC